MYFLVGVTCLVIGFVGGIMYADNLTRLALKAIPKLPPYITKE